MWLPIFKYLKKFAKFGQFNLPSGDPYEGPYTVSSDGTARAGDFPTKSSPVLIPREGVLDLPNEGEPVYSSDTIYPTPEDYKKGYMMRYFAKKDTSDKIIELNKNNFKEYSKKPFIQAAEVKWIIAKPAKDIFNQGYLFKGAATRNKENINIASIKVKGLNKFIEEYDKFVNIESDVEGYKFEELPEEEQSRIISVLPSNLQKKSVKKPKPRFKKPPKRIPSQLGNTTQIPASSGLGGGRAFTGYEDEGFNEESEFNSSKSSTDQNERLYQY